MMTQKTAGGGRYVTTQQEIDNPITFINHWQLSYKEGAAVFDVDYVTVRRWFNGDRRPDRGFCLAARLMHQIWEQSGKPHIVA